MLGAVAFKVPVPKAESLEIREVLKAQDKGEEDGCGAAEEEGCFIPKRPLQGEISAEFKMFTLKTGGQTLQFS